jgi:hypothetical protein
MDVSESSDRISPALSQSNSELPASFGMYNTTPHAGLQSHGPSLSTLSSPQGDANDLNTHSYAQMKNLLSNDNLEAVATNGHEGRPSSDLLNALPESTVHERAVNDDRKMRSKERQSAARGLVTSENLSPRTVTDTPVEGEIGDSSKNGKESDVLAPETVRPNTRSHYPPKKNGLPAANITAAVPPQERRRRRADRLKIAGLADIRETPPMPSLSGPFQRSPNVQPSTRVIERPDLFPASVREGVDREPVSVLQRKEPPSRPVIKWLGAEAIAMLAREQAEKKPVYVPQPREEPVSKPAIRRARTDLDMRLAQERKPEVIVQRRERSRSRNSVRIIDIEPEILVRRRERSRSRSPVPIRPSSAFPIEREPAVTVKRRRSLSRSPVRIRSPIYVERTPEVGVERVRSRSRSPVGIPVPIYVEREPEVGLERERRPYRSELRSPIGVRNPILVEKEPEEVIVECRRRPRSLIRSPVGVRNPIPVDREPEEVIAEHRRRPRSLSRSPVGVRNPIFVEREPEVKMERQTGNRADVAKKIEPTTQNNMRERHMPDIRPPLRRERSLIFAKEIREQTTPINMRERKNDSDVEAIKREIRELKRERTKIISEQDRYELGESGNVDVGESAFSALGREEKVTLSTPGKKKTNSMHKGKSYEQQQDVPRAKPRSNILAWLDGVTENDFADESSANPLISPSSNPLGVPLSTASSLPPSPNPKEDIRGPPHPQDYEPYQVIWERKPYPAPAVPPQDAPPPPPPHKDYLPVPPVYELPDRKITNPAPAASREYNNSAVPKFDPLAQCRMERPARARETRPSSPIPRTAQAGPVPLRRGHAVLRRSHTVRTNKHTRSAPAKEYQPRAPPQSTSLKGPSSPTKIPTKRGLSSQVKINKTNLTRCSDAQHQYYSDSDEWTADSDADSYLPFDHHHRRQRQKVSNWGPGTIRGMWFKVGLRGAAVALGLTKLLT